MAPPLAGAYLVSGFTGLLGLPDFDPLTESFVCRDFDWPLIRSRSCNFAVISSDNDQYVPLERGQTIADNLAVPLTLVPGGGHLNAESGHMSFPLLMDMVSRQLINC